MQRSRTPSGTLKALGHGHPTDSRELFVASLPHEVSTTSPTKRSLSVLLVDDAPVIIDLYPTTLRKLPGVSVSAHLVHTVAQAQSIFQLQHPTPDVVITDLSFSPSSTQGFSFAQWIRTHYPNVTIVLTTSIWADGEHSAEVLHIRQLVKDGVIDAVFQKGHIDDLAAFVQSKAEEARV
ncbi:response regulator [Candidatus Micrarchaeota archaeon]|nr:response regulator [Candidatus Micrarchaeota archaeon]